MDDVRKLVENRVAALTAFPKCDRKRLVIYIWIETERNAHIFCNCLKDMEFLQAEGVSSHSRESLLEKLEEKFQEYKGKIDRKEVFFPYGAYVLAVGAVQNLCGESLIAVIKKYFTEYQVDYVRIFAYKTPIESSILPFINVEWRVNVSQPETVIPILLKALYDVRLLGEEKELCESGTRIFRLNLNKYNAIQEKMCRQLLNAITMQMVTSSSLEKKAKCYLSMDDYWKTISLQCPKPEFLPIFCESEKSEASLFTKFCKKARRGDKGKKETISQALWKLFGMEGDKLRTEWLREEIDTNFLPQICQEVIDRNRESLFGRIRKNFSLYEQQDILPSRALEFQNECGQKLTQMESRIKETLETEFLISFDSADELFRNVEIYFELCQQWTRICGEYHWWEKMADYLHSVSLDNKESYYELQAVCGILEGLCISSRKEKFSFLEEESRDTISSMETLSEKIEHSVNFANFTGRDIDALTACLNRKYINSEYYHVDDAKRPYLCLMFHEDICYEKIMRESPFCWMLLPVSFLPRSVIYELQIYKCDT